MYRNVCVYIHTLKIKIPSTKNHSIHLYELSF